MARSERSGPDPIIGLHQAWGPPDSWSLLNAWRTRVEGDADRPFLAESSVDDFVTYGQAWQHIRDLAGVLTALGVSPGDRVVILGKTDAMTVWAWFAVNLVGATEVTVNASYRGAPLVHAVNLPRAEVAIVAPEMLTRFVEHEEDFTAVRRVLVLGDADVPEPTETRSYLRLGEVEAAQPAAVLPHFTDPASILYTSGTSGPAKGVVMPHGQTYVMARQTIELLSLTAADTFYCFHSLAHATKFTAVASTLVAGGRIVLDPVFEPDAWAERVVATEATATVAHGPMLEMVLRAREDSGASPAAGALGRLRVVLTAGASADLAKDAERLLGLQCVEAFGMTEAYLIIRPENERERVPAGSCGRPNSALFEVRLVDPETDDEVGTGEIGEITVRPLHPGTMMREYVHMPERTIESWRNLRFHTGDLARMDEAGWVYFVDRVSDRIRRKAENISSYEIERAALEHPFVQEAAAVGVPAGPGLDDEIKLCLVTSRPLDYEAMIEHLVRLLPHYMVPRYLDVVAELPRSVTNKVQKARLRVAEASTAWDRAAAGVSVREIADRIGVR